MGYDDTLAERIRRALPTHPDVTEKKMFGGLAFLHRGKMFCGIVKDELMVRVGPEKYEEALRETHVRPMDFTGRPMKGHAFVESAGCRTDREVRHWVERAMILEARFWIGQQSTSCQFEHQDALRL